MVFHHRYIHIYKLSYAPFDNCTSQILNNVAAEDSSDSQSDAVEDN